MIYLTTGQPGTGKTLRMVSMLKKRKDLQNRPLYVDGINGLDPHKIPHEALPDGCDGSNWQEWLPANAILVIDECQRYWRPRANGSKVPESVQAMETHRHKGVDLFLLTQHPRLLDINVKSFVENHVHLSKTQLGSRRAWEWQRAGNPESKADINDALVRPYKLDKSVYDLYKSAEVHTKIKTGKSIWVYLMPIIVIAAVALIWYAYSSTSDALTAEPKPQAAIAASEPVAAGGEAPAAPPDAAGRYALEAPTATDTAIKPQDYIPAFGGQPWTAPVYKAHNQNINTMPFPVGCVKSQTKCTCYTEQATPIRGMEEGLCLDFVENGIYNPYKTPQQSQPPTAAEPAPVGGAQVAVLDNKARPGLMPPPFESVQ